VFRATARPRLFCDRVPFPECIAALPDGSLLATCGGDRYDEPGSILRISPGGRVLGAFADLRRRFLGVVCLPSGEIIACDATVGALVRFGPSGAFRGEVSTAGDWKLSKPNGAVQDGQGGVWIADSGTAEAGEATGAVVYLSPEGVATLAWEGLTYPNGVAIDPAGSWLYVAETRDDRLRRFEILEPGKLSPPQDFGGPLTTGPDGISADQDGNLYVAVTRSSSIVGVSSDGETAVLIKDAALAMPTFALVQEDLNRILVPSLFADTIHAIDGVFTAAGADAATVLGTGL
jgi:sugar lactone lactonase YvrE